MRMTGGGSLLACCAEYGIKFNGRAHAALHDARVTACLLQELLMKNPDVITAHEASAPPSWPILQIPQSSLFPRGSSDNPTSVVPSYIQLLAERLSANSFEASHIDGEMDYRALLWRVLEDGRIEETEGNSLIDVATHWGLSFDHIKSIHLEYLTQLAKAAWADRHISESERREIQLVAQLLGFERLSDDQLCDLLNSSGCTAVTETKKPPSEDWSGKSVCFTGECSCSMKGKLISREIAEKLAIDKGLRVMPSVTKNLDLLVVADPNTQSGKAKKAKKYGLRIVHEPVFWRKLGVLID